MSAAPTSTTRDRGRGPDAGADAVTAFARRPAPVVIVDQVDRTAELVKMLGSFGWRVTAPPVEQLGPEGLRLEIGRLVPVVVLVDPDALTWNPWPAIPIHWSDLVAVVWAHDLDAEHRAHWLRLGASSALSKPTDPGMLDAELRAAAGLLQRPDAAALAPIRAGELELDERRMRCLVAGHELELGAREFTLLLTLATDQGRVLPHADLYRRVWGTERAPRDRALHHQVKRLREKLAAASPGWRYLHSRRGIGYRFEAEIVAVPDDV